MTFSDTHLVGHLAEVVTNATAPDDTRIHILNATATEIINHTVNGINATAKAIAAAKPSKLSRQMPWIELALIPIFPVIACYLFTKLADRYYYSKDNVNAAYQELPAEADKNQAAPITTPGTRLGKSTLPHGTAESSRMAGANAENPVIIDLESSGEEGYVAESEAQSEDLEDTWSQESS